MEQADMCFRLLSVGILSSRFVLNLKSQLSHSLAPLAFSLAGAVYSGHHA